jgi:hypothetical protein
MTYLRSLFFNFLVVFFVDRAIPGVTVTYYEDVPNILADIFFSFAVGFLNASVFPFYALMEAKITNARLFTTSFVISYGAFALISAVSFGVQVNSFLGFFLGGTIVWITACLSNHLEWQHSMPKS